MEYPFQLDQFNHSELKAPAGLKHTLRHEVTDAFSGSKKPLLLW